jgi:hypothetical protein
MRASLRRELGLMLVLGLWGMPLRAAEAPATPGFVQLDLPAWVLIDDPAAAKTRPWLLLIDDPQCPHCMRLHHVFAKLRATDPELRNAVVARLPFPLPGHDQSVHIVEDAFCLEASRAGRAWSGNAYLDWLLDDTWSSEPGWASATAEDVIKEGGLFDAHYEAHQVESSRRREYQTEFAQREATCEPATSGTGFTSCHGEAACDALCAEKSKCMTACGPSPSAADGCSECSLEPILPAPAAKNTASGPQCAAKCTEAFVEARYRQFSKSHSECLLAAGPDSAQARTAAAFSWAIAHQIPGTPTFYVGHPSIGFREPEEADDLPGVVANLDRLLAEVRARLQAPPRR